MNFIYYLKELILFHRLNQELKKSVSLIIIELKNHSIEHTPTEIAAGGILLYINKKAILSFKNYLHAWQIRIYFY